MTTAHAAAPQTSEGVTGTRLPAGTAEKTRVCGRAAATAQSGLRVLYGVNTGYGALQRVGPSYLQPTAPAWGQLAPNAHLNRSLDALATQKKFWPRLGPQSQVTPVITLSTSACGTRARSGERTGCGGSEQTKSPRTAPRGLKPGLVSSIFMLFCAKFRKTPR